MSGDPNWDSPPTTYGPNGPPQYTSSYDPYADHSSDIGSDATIITIYPMVMDERPDDIDQAAAGWTAFATQMQATKTELHDNYNALATDWDSDTGDIFTGFVVNTTSTLDNWQNAATSNATALSTLAGQIRKYQGLMKTMWDDGNGHGFAPDLAAADKQYKKGNALWDSPSNWADAWDYTFNGKGYKTELDPVLDHYTQRVKAEIVEPLNQAFSDAFTSLGPGMKWNGPTNGPTMDEITNAIKKLNAPSITVPGGVPSAPGVGRPPMPEQPTMPDLPRTPSAVAPPPVPRPRMPVQPKMPNAPTTPQAPTAPDAVTRPSMPTEPSMPTMPNAPSAPGAPVAPEGLGAIPPLPNALRTPGGLPSTPEAPSTSGLGAGAPPSGFGEGEGMGGPGRPSAPGLPKSLQGRGGMPEEPEMPPGMRSGMRTPPPHLGGRGKPDRKSTRPGGPNNEEPEMPPGMRSGLSGRNGRQNERPGGSARPGGPGGDDTPPNRLGSPRNLQGIRDRKPRYRPGSPEAEEMPLRRMPTLNGRLAPESAVEETLETAEQALRPGLGGRGLSRPAERKPERREPRPELRPTVDFVGDAELFAAGKSAPAVIDRPQEAAPVVAENPALRPKAPAGA